MTTTKTNTASNIAALADAVKGKSQPQSMDEMLKELARLQAENEALKQRPGKALTCKVSEKGAVSVYGLGQFPVTLYKEQWPRLIAFIPELEAFIKANEGKLRTKGEEDGEYAKKIGMTPEEYAKKLADSKAAHAKK